jgi:AbrB family looped-hinge helix DNA binding protein
MVGSRMEAKMEFSSVGSEGQVTIPSAIRQQLGLKEGSKVAFRLVNGHIEMHFENPSASEPIPASKSGFGMLKSRRPPVPVDFDPAELLKR